MAQEKNKSFWVEMKSIEWGVMDIKVHAVDENEARTKADSDYGGKIMNIMEITKENK